MLFQMIGWKSLKSDSEIFQNHLWIIVKHLYFKMKVIFPMTNDLNHAKITLKDALNPIQASFFFFEVIQFKLLFIPWEAKFKLKDYLPSKYSLKTKLGFKSNETDT